MVHHTDARTRPEHGEQLTTVGTQVYTDQWRGYNHLDRPHLTLGHARHAWVRDADAIGIREVHLNTAEGMGTLLRNFMRPFRGVHKKFLAGYLALCEFPIHLKRITPDFSAALVALHPPLT